MDPNVTLGNIRALAARVRDEEMENDELFDVAQNLAEQVQALDEWLASGGFAPAAWRKR